MAKRKINKSELIREYMKANPNVGPTDAASALTKQHGVKFTPTAVSNAKAAGKTKKKGRKQRAMGGPDGVGIMRKDTAMAGGIRGNGQTHGDIFDAMKLIRQAVEIIGAEMAKKAADLFGGK
jgi:hypothetical protein